MKYIYIKNYVKLTPKQKNDFLDLIDSRVQYFKVEKHEIVLGEESIVLEFKKESDMKIAYINFQEFFKNIETISVYIVRKTIENDTTILTFKDLNKRIRV